MRSVARETLVEALVGLAVVLFAIWFVSFAWGRAGGGRASGAYSVSALFPSAAGVDVGTDVKVAGLKIGSVTAQTLDPASYEVKLVMALDPTVKLPSDSSAAVTSEGLLGGTNVTLTPGGSPTMLKNGDTIADTQGAIDMMGLIGQFVNGRSGGGSDTAGAGGGTAKPAAKP